MAERNGETLAIDGKSAYEKGDFPVAAQAFRDAADWYTANNQPLEAAEMMNNLSVTLLQDKQAQEALLAVQGTDTVFAQTGDLRRQGMALGNQAAALEALGETDKAADLYERSAEIFAEAGEGDMQSMVLRSAGALRAKRGKIQDSAIAMFGSLSSVKNPTWVQRLLKFIVRLLPR